MIPGVLYLEAGAPIAKSWFVDLTGCHQTLLSSNPRIDSNFERSRFKVLIGCAAKALVRRRYTGGKMCWEKISSLKRTASVGTISFHFLIPLLSDFGFVRKWSCRVIAARLVLRPIKFFWSRGPSRSCPGRWSRRLSPSQKFFWRSEQVPKNQSGRRRKKTCLLLNWKSLVVDGSNKKIKFHFCLNSFLPNQVQFSFPVVRNGNPNASKFALSKKSWNNLKNQLFFLLIRLFLWTCLNFLTNFLALNCSESTITYWRPIW